jgi:hypothetical protein
MGEEEENIRNGLCGKLWIGIIWLRIVKSG